MRLLLTSALLLLASMSAAEAVSQPAVQWDGSNAWFFSDDDGPFTSGFRFRPEVDLKVTALGAFDYLGDGLELQHVVAIWTTNGGAPLVSATVLNGTQASLVGAFRYAPVSNVVLSAHTEYIIGASEYFGARGDIYPYQPQNFSMARGVTFLAPRESSAEISALLFPADEYSPGAPLTANFQFVPLPRLAIGPQSTSVVQLSWTTNVSGFQLESAPALPAPIWNTVTNVPSVVGENFVVTLPRSDNERYFRLSAP